MKIRNPRTGEYDYEITILDSYAVQQSVTLCVSSSDCGRRQV
jgi:hypothetical protein